MNQKQKYIHLALFLFSLSLLVGIVVYLNKNSQALLKLTTVSPLYILIFFFVYAIHYYLLSLTQSLPLQKHNIYLDLNHKFGLSVLSDLFNTFLPAKGGTALRMLYLKNKFKFPMRSFLSMGFAIVSSGYTALGIIGTIYLQFFVKNNHPLFIFIESVFIAMALSGIILGTTSSLMAKIFKVKRNLSPKMYLSDYKLISKTTLTYLLVFALYPLKVLLSFKAIGVNLNMFESVNISMILLIISFFPVLPGNMGIKEMATAYIASQYGISFEVSLLASLIDRAILFLFILPVGSYYYWDLVLERKFSVLNFLPSRNLNPIDSNQTLN